MSKAWVKNLLVIIVLALGLYQWLQDNSQLNGSPDSAQSSSSDEQLARAFEQQQSDLQIEGSGRVEHILPDDTRGSQHQKFILRLASGQKLLVAHNIDLAPRIHSLAKGDRVSFYGEYEWNDKGGVMHWTHRDPKGRHPGGWLKHQGKTYH